ncbi:protein of unknown function [Bradyrhizobium vignae]|uniref:Uncharacterized protein n=1 Tax=Bradyrhizobium vignae TaxID=1549949 RepID=A0A2U3PTF4_9BRAD|nr:protein of unknown function [Bradyrhizobium vignae]
MTSASRQRTRFVRASPHRLAAITGASDGKEPPRGLRGKVVLSRPLLKKRTLARARSVLQQFVCDVTASSVTQKPTRLVISWRQRNPRYIFLSRITALIHFRGLGSIWRPKV